MSNHTVPVFVYSLPRSGSTLLQRILSAHSQVSTASETWALLPQVYALKETGVYSEYQHYFSCQALNDFITTLPGKKDDYVRHLRAFMLALYHDAANGQGRYFIDKTPRYHLIVNEIIDMFPDAKHIFLWRNPLSIIASMIDTWGNGSWNIYKYNIDLLKGFPGLIDAYIRNRDQVYSLLYENLVSDLEDELSGLLEYLGLDHEKEVMSGHVKVQLEGSMGDPTGSELYTEVSDEALTKWKSIITSPLRKRWCRNYINMIGADSFHTVGYNIETLLSELDRQPASARTLPGDIVFMSIGLLYNIIEPHIFLDKIRMISRKQPVYVNR